MFNFSPYATWLSFEVFFIVFKSISEMDCIFFLMKIIFILKWRKHLDKNLSKKMWKEMCKEITSLRRNMIFRIFKSKDIWKQVSYTRIRLNYYSRINKFIVSINKCKFKFAYVDTFSTLFWCINFYNYFWKDREFICSNFNDANQSWD